MSKARRVYPQEFRLTAVRWLNTEGLTVAELASELHVSTSSLYRWRAEYGGQIGTDGSQKPITLARSGDLSKGHLLHNRRFSCQVWDGEKWADQGELALFENTGFLQGEKLYNLYYHPETQSVIYSFGKGDAHRSGRLYMTQDHRAFSGTMQRGAMGSLLMVHGTIAPTVFNTQREKKSTSQFVDWQTFTLGSEWVDEQTGKILKAIFLLGSTDISNRTAVTNVHQWQTTIQMQPDTNPFGGQDQFTIVVDYRGQSFVGTYTDENGTVYDWKGTAQDASTQATTADAASFVALDGKPQLQPVHPMFMTAAARAADDTGPDLSIQDLMNVSSINSVVVKGQTQVLDTAQVQTGKYFQSILINSLTGTDSQGNTWISDFFGDKQPLPANVQTVMDAHQPFYQATAVMNLGQMLHDSLLNDPAHKDVVARIDNDKLAAAWKALGTNKDYAAQSSALYIEGYRDGVPGIQPYLGDNAKNWADQLYNQITSDDFLNTWAVQVASEEFKNVKQQMYEWYVQLLVLDPDNVDQANQMLSTTFAVVIGSAFNQTKWTEDLKPYLSQAIQNMLEGDTTLFQDAILQHNAEAMREILKKMISGFDSQEEFLDQLVNALNIWANMPANANRSVVRAGPDLAEMFDVFKTIRVQAGQVLTSLMFAAGAGYLIYELVADKDLNPVQEIGLGLLATGFVVKSIEKLLATQLGAWFSKPLEEGASRFTRVAKNIGKWFTEGGVEVDNWATKLLGKSSAEFFAARLGPALAVVGIAVAAWQLAQDIEVGDVRDIVFDSLNTFFALGDLVFIGLEMFSFAWAGPVGLALA
ncbi:MAG: transposase, partial [Chloroflexi bacterium]|nr:transposase [Chloroflexota bacterium]